MKFKIGDRIRVIRKSSADFVFEMKRAFGKNGTIIEIRGRNSANKQGYKIKFDRIKSNWVYYEDSLCSYPSFRCRKCKNKLRCITGTR